MKNLTLTLLLAISVFLTACKKDKIEVDKEKVFLQVDVPKDTAPGYVSSWAVTLKPDKTAEVIPGGDIVYGGNYEIKGSSLNIKTDQVNFDFDILSATEIKDKKYGVVLRLKEN
jgi:hypothetical protein